MSVIEQNKAELEAMVFALAERNKPTIVAALYEAETARDAVIAYLNQTLDAYQAMTLDFRGEQVDSLLQFLQQALPPEAQQRDTGRVTHLVHLIRLDPLLSEVKGHRVKASALAAQINLERERYFQDFNAVFVLWLSRHSYNRLRLDDAPDFMDWVTASFVIESTGEATVSSLPFSLPVETPQMRTQAEVASLRQKAGKLRRSVARIEHRPQLNARDKKACFNLLRELGSIYTKTQDFEEAATALEQALALAKSEALFGPAALGHLLMDLGDATVAQGKLPYALSVFKEALAAYQKEGDELQIGRAYTSIGRVYLELGDLEGALAVFEQQAERFKTLYKADPENVNAKNGLAVSCQFLGLTHSEQGDFGKALTFFEQYNQLQEELYKALPEDMAFKNGLAISYQFLGQTHSALGDMERALVFFEQYNQLEAELHESYPEKLEFRNGLASSYGKLGEMHSAMGNSQEALAFLLQFNESMETLYKDYPQSIEFKYGLATSYGRLGEAHNATGKLKESLAFFLKYHELMEHLHKDYPQNIAYKNGLAVSCAKLGQIHSALGNLQQALAFFVQYNQLARALYEAYPQNKSLKKGLAISYAKIGQTHRKLGEFSSALAFFKEETKLFEELHQTYPENVGFKNGLAISCYKLGAFHRDHIKDLPQAKAQFQQAEQLWAELVRDAPQYAKFQQFLAQVREEMAGLDA